MENKQLWLHLFHREIELRGLPTSDFLHPIDTVTTQDVIAWFRNALILNKNYESGYNETLRRTNIDQHVTWIKLIRGRWVLVASSNLLQSKLVVWDVHSSEHDSYKTVFYFIGPVVEALVQDDGLEVLIAFTLGTRCLHMCIYQPYLLIFVARKLHTILCELFLENEVRIRRLREFPGLAFARFLKRPYIGFALHDEDDSYPIMLNWENGLTRTLVPPDSFRS